MPISEQAPDRVAGQNLSNWNMAMVKYLIKIILAFALMLWGLYFVMAPKAEQFDSDGENSTQIGSGINDLLSGTLGKLAPLKKKSRDESE